MASCLLDEGRLGHKSSVLVSSYGSSQDLRGRVQGSQVFLPYYETLRKEGCLKRHGHGIPSVLHNIMHSEVLRWRIRQVPLKAQLGPFQPDRVQVTCPQNCGRIISAALIPLTYLYAVSLTTVTELFSTYRLRCSQVYVDNTNMATNGANGMFFVR